MSATATRSTGGSHSSDERRTLGADGVAGGTRKGVATPPSAAFDADASLLWGEDTTSSGNHHAIDFDMLPPEVGGGKSRETPWKSVDAVLESDLATVASRSAPTEPLQRVTPNKKRKNFSKSDDLMLLRQVNTDHPYKSTRGGVMDAWSAVAAKLKKLEDFSKREITGKSAQARFNLLIERHRAYDRTSAAASGVSEDYDETIQLLDDLLLEVEENAKEEEQKSEEQKEKLAAEAKTGKFIRDEAVARLKKRKERSSGGQSESTTPRKVTVFDLMREDNEKEREMRAEQWKQEQEMKIQQKRSELEDRKEEREFRLQIARLENERFKTLLQLAKMKARNKTSSPESDSDDLDMDSL
ncbi:hypothetical protein DVH05_026847 [Phytophthora capsici]|nr:hypothetical protein DVH05_026847 [Phytophthora capsici]